MLRPQLVRTTADGMLEYKSWLDDLAMEQRSQEVRTHICQIVLQSSSQGLSVEQAGKVPVTQSCTDSPAIANPAHEVHTMSCALLANS